MAVEEGTAVGVQGGEAGKPKWLHVKVEDEAEHKTVDVWVE